MSEKPVIYGLRTTANREDQVMDFLTSNVIKRKLEVYSVIKAHGMRGYIFVEASSRSDAEQAAFNIPYARGILPKEIDYQEIEHMLEQVKIEMNIMKYDIVEIISGPFKREQAKVSRIDKTKEEVVVELLEAAVPIPITVKMDAVKVIRRESDEEDEKEEEPVIPLVREQSTFVMPGQKSQEAPVEKPKEESSEKETDEEKESSEEEKTEEPAEDSKEETAEEEKEEAPAEESSDEKTEDSKEEPKTEEKDNQ